MVLTWLQSSGSRLELVFAMKSHLALLAMIRSIAMQSRIKGIASTEEEAFRRIRQSNPGFLICSDQLAQGNGFSLCKRATKVVADLKVVLVWCSLAIARMQGLLWRAGPWPWCVKTTSYPLRWK
jgi:DNA-binding NarL/FixJ family response regulator